MAMARFGSGAHIEREANRFCSCQVILLSLKLSIEDYRVQRGKISPAIFTKTSEEFCPGGTFRSLEQEKEEGMDLLS